MKIIHVGASGTIGTEVAKALERSHELIKVGRTSGDAQADITSTDSLEALFDLVGEADAVVCTAGDSRFGELESLEEDDFRVGIESKLLGQINLVRVGIGRVGEGGSFTLTSGVLGRRPMPGSASASVVNAALEGFVRAAALDMPRDIRINVVSPGWVKETMDAMNMDSSTGQPAAEVAEAYVRAVEGGMTGETLDT